MANEKPVAELCREYGISRKTGHKWIKRYKERGTSALVDESRRPLRSPLETTPEQVVEIVRLRNAHPSWGPKKLWALLAREVPTGTAAPSIATVARVLKRAGLSRRKHRRTPRPPQSPLSAPRVTVLAPNDLWTADFKGWWRTGDGTRCDPLTVRDSHSRFVLALKAMPKTSALHVRRVFEDLFRTYGVPKAIQTDNGQPFACTRALGGHTKLSAWWVSLGITPVRSRVGCPQDNGAHERMHCDIRFEIQDHRARTLRTQQTACDEWREEFNYVRPHEALSFRTPAELYRPSARQWSGDGAIVVGGYPEDCELRRVGNMGSVTSYAGQQRIYVSKAFAQYWVGFQRTAGPERLVWFYNQIVGRFTPGVDPLVQHYAPPESEGSADLDEAHLDEADLDEAEADLDEADLDELDLEEDEERPELVAELAVPASETVTPSEVTG
jgi:transposase InsO family protein